MSSTLAAIPETYATKDELEKAISEIEHPTVDLTGYATEEWVNSQEFAKKSDISHVEAVVDSNNDIIGLTIGANTYDLDHFATTETVTQINENIQNIENTYVTNETLEQKHYVTEQHITQNYITIQDAADTYVTNEKVTEVVTNEVETVVTEQIETKVTEVIEQKIEGGEITVQSDSISYDTWE